MNCYPDCQAVLPTGSRALLDKSGTFIIKPQFGQVYSFSEGLAIVIINVKKSNPVHHSELQFPVVGDYGFIDRSGKVVIKPQSKWAGDFSEGLAPVKVEGEYGYFDGRGKVREVCLD